ncbi:TetR/AcrR family transcriptional regulator [Streptomyces sp. NPDC001002]
MASTPQERRAARHNLPVSDTSPKRGRRTKPITVDGIIEVALDIVAREGYPALTMRRVATALDTGSASLYAHVVNKDDLDELLIGRLCAEISLPQPDPATWREQITDVCAQLRDQYLRYPGISRAALAAAPTNNDTLRLAECLLALLLAGGVAPQSAAWGIDALSLYISSYTLEISLVGRGDGEWVVSRDEMRQRLADLPDTFPHVKRHAAELTAGTDHERFDFTIELILDGLARRG